MNKRSNRHFLREKEAKRIVEEFARSVKTTPDSFFGLEPRVELVELESTSVYVINGTPTLIEEGGRLLPTLFFRGLFPFLPKIVVNMGAVPYICNGADVMAPGVVRVEGDFNKGTTLLINDERFDKCLAIGIALVDQHAVNALVHGKVAKNLHYVGDKLWKLLKRKFDTI